MDFVVKILAFLALGLVLLAANAWYVGLIFRSVSDPGLVIAPIRIVGGSAADKDMDEALARMLLVRLRSVMAELEQAQNQLEGTFTSTARGPSIGVVPTIFAQAQTVRLNAQLFEPANIDVKVAGLEVGGVVSWIQRWFSEDRTLNFTVSLQEHSAIIAGNVEATNSPSQRPVWVQIDNKTPDAIVDALALAVIQRAWAKREQQINELTAAEFRALVKSIGKVSEINRRVLAFRLSGRAEYATVLDDIAPLAERITSWNELTYFVATVAEAAEDNRRALLMYQRLKEIGKAPIADDILEKKLNALLATSQNSGERSLDEYRRQAGNAASELNKLFGFQLTPPPIELTEPNFLNAFWDGSKIHIPPGLEDIPDLIVHEMTFPYIEKLWPLRYEGQTGALVASYTDVLTSVVKQAFLRQTAEQADWTIAPGAIAWLTGKTLAQRAADKRPLRTLKAPGEAYDDPKLGRDPQVANYKQMVVTSDDNGGIHTNSGIPNKAFYEAAMKIGTEKAARIWLEALHQFKADVDLPTAARTIEAVATRLHGDNSLESTAVQEAWKSVGL
jgi:Thermolysin metallopeptidase, alpha-helical domain